MNLITLDFETYFDQDYSLSKMTTEEYVRDPRFKVHCIGVKLGSSTAGVLHGYIAGLETQRYKNGAILCHHAQFDGLILSHHYGVRPAMWFDTLSMARLVFPHAKSHSLGALAEMLGIGKKDVPYESFKGVRDLPPDLYNRVAEGCANDVELTYAVFQKLLPHVSVEELWVIDLTIRMFTEPALALDRPRLENYLSATRLAKEELLRQLGVSKADLQSSEKFASLLKALGIDPPVKPSPSNSERQIYAFAKTDEGMKNLVDSPDERIATLAAARLGQKSTLGETRAQRLLDMSSRGALPVYLNYCGAHTTRWSGGDSLNWQNFTRGSEIRLSIMAPEGHRLIIGDLSQIECRMLNWLAGEEHVLQAFRENRDLYSEGATRFYGRPISKVDKVERHLGKTLELGCGYGMGWQKFQATCKQGALGGPAILLDDNEAQAAVNSYRASHTAVTQLWKYGDAVLRALHSGGHGYAWGPMWVNEKKIILPNGAALDYSNLTIIDNEYHMIGRRATTKIYGAKLVENVIQALSRVVLSQAMLKIARAAPKHIKIVMTSHDELVCVVREEIADKILEFVLTTLRTPPAWCPGVPLDAEGAHDVRYSK